MGGAGRRDVDCGWREEMRLENCFADRGPTFAEAPAGKPRTGGPEMMIFDRCE